MTYNLTNIDINPEVVDFLQSTSGDFDNFRVVQADITNLRKYNLQLFSENAYPCITCSEILEHLDYPLQVAQEMVSVASEYIICSVPALPDNNPEHIQLFYDKKRHRDKTILRPIQNKQTNLKHLWLTAGLLLVKSE